MPSFFIFVFLLLGFFFSLKKKKIGIFFILIGILSYFIFSTGLADFLITPLESHYKEISEDEIANIDMLVLLTGGIKGENNPSSSQLSESTLSRAVGATQIYFKKEKNIKIIISGSDPLSLVDNVGSLISDFFVSLGVSREDIILEENSKDTYQSALELKKMVGEKEFALVTSAMHMPRSIYIFEKVGLNPIPAPTDFKKEEVLSILDILPDSKNLKKSDLAFHEYFGLIYYKIRY